jgi:AcrR family transcriptional regulator
VNEPPLSSFRLPRGRHGLPAELVAESQRWRLLAAAGEVLETKGYTSTTSADIADRAGVSRTTFYEQFENVEACLIAAHETVADGIVDIVSECTEAGDDTAKVGAAIEGALQFLASEPSMAKLLGAEVVAGVPAISAARDRLADRLAGMLRGGRAAPGVAGGDRVGSIDSRLVAGALAVVAERIDSGDAGRLPELGSELTELISTQYAGLTRRQFDSVFPKQEGVDPANET